jgi:plastocyanin
MRRPGRKATIAVCAGALALIGAAGAYAADTIIAPVGADTLGFSSNDYTMDQGEKATFHNADPGVPHNVTANGKLSGKPLFRSPTITGDASAAVGGTQFLIHGDYSFFCTIHPNMTATLHVTTAGTPVARPNIKVAILSSKLARVRSSGKARVKVKAVTKSDDVALKLKLGNRQLASKANIDLAVGQVRKLTLKLGKKARNALANRTQAKLKLIGTVPFGKTRTATKLLK